MRRSQSPGQPYLRLLQKLGSQPAKNYQALCAKMLRAAMRLTKSTGSFFAMVEEDPQTMRCHSLMSAKPGHWPAPEEEVLSVRQAAALWADSPGPLMANRSGALHKLRPAALHQPIRRLLVVPGLKHGRLQALLAVVNKPGDYVADDLCQLEAFAAGAIPVMECQLAHAALQRVQQELELKVVERTAEFMSANEQLKQEVAERRQAEEQIRQSEKRYRELYESLRDGSAAVDLKGHIVECNPAFLAMLGYSFEEISRLTYVNITPPKWQALEARIIKEQVLQQGYSELYEKEYIRKDGSLIPVEICTYLIQDDAGRPRGMWAITRDITERRQAQAALRAAYEDLEKRVQERTAQLRREILDRREAEKALGESEARFRAVADSTPDGIVTVDHCGTIIYWNNGARNIFGYEQEEIIGKPVQVLIPARLRATDRSLMEGVRQAGGMMRAHKPVVSVGLRKGGVEFPSEISFSAWRVGDRIFFSAIIRDITDRTQAEEHIHSLTQQLIRIQEGERQRISRDLHDHIGQNLSTLKVGMGALPVGWPDMPEAVGSRLSALTSILQQTITAVREMAYDLRPPGIDQLGLVHAVYQHCQEFGAASGLNIDFCSAGLEDAKLDFDTEINLYRLVQEALGNVRKHARARHVAVRLVLAHPDIILRIEDDGRGFDMKRGLKAAAGEKRMGLTSMRERVELLAGRMDIRSGPRRGTKIIIQVPYRGKKSG
jgi:PAS domain S-box-containing protein